MEMVEATSAADADEAEDEMVRVPGGHIVPRGCIAQVPNRGTFDPNSAAALRRCDPSHVTTLAPEIQIYAADTHFKSEAPLTSFTADWTVPPYPESKRILRSQVVYFWPGFKATAPEMGYPVLQPVLQYGERGHPRWALQSWFVDAHDRHYPVVTAPAISVSPGDRITSYMRLSADNKTWTVSGTNLATGEDSTLHIKYRRAGDTDYDYAMLVNENINVNARCDLMPASKKGVVFTNVTVNGVATPPWTTRANCKGDPRCDCDNAASVDSKGDVTLSWDYTK